MISNLWPITTVIHHMELSYLLNLFLYYLIWSNNSPCIHTLSNWIIYQENKIYEKSVCFINKKSKFIFLSFFFFLLNSKRNANNYLTHINNCVSERSLRGRLFFIFIYTTLVWLYHPSFTKTSYITHICISKNLHENIT